MKLNVGIIGLGYGKQTLIPVLEINPKYKIFAVSNSTSPKVPSEWTSNANKVYPLISPDELIHLQELDILVVATPPKYQEKFCIKAIENGKHIYCEKPVGLKWEQTKNISYAAKNKNVQAIVDYQYRYDPGIQRLRTRAEEEFFGELHRQPEEESEIFCAIFWTTCNLFHPCNFHFQI